MDTYNGLAPFAAGSDTSYAAAVSVTPKTATVREQVANYIAGRDDGATQDEVSAALHILHQSASARVRELVLAGRIVDSGARRPTRYGKSARVYKVVA